MHRLHIALRAVLVAGFAVAFSQCGQSELFAAEDGVVESAEELHVKNCIRQLFGGIGFDGSIPNPSALDGGLDREAFKRCLFGDGGVPGIPGVPGLDGGKPAFPGHDGGFPTPPAFDGGLFQECGQGCACPAGFKCINPFKLVCPDPIAVCVPSP